MPVTESVVDLCLDRENFAKGGAGLSHLSADILQLKSEISNSLAPLQADWRTDAGRQFFETLDGELLKRLSEQSAQLARMSRDLSAAAQAYEEVFRAADALASLQ